MSSAVQWARQALLDEHYFINVEREEDFEWVSLHAKATSATALPSAAEVTRQIARYIHYIRSTCATMGVLYLLLAKVSLTDGAPQPLQLGSTIVPLKDRQPTSQ